MPALGLTKFLSNHVLNARPATRYYADPSAVSVEGVRVVDLL